MSAYSALCDKVVGQCPQEAEELSRGTAAVAQAVAGTARAVESSVGLINTAAVQFTDSINEATAVAHAQRAAIATGAEALVDVDIHKNPKPSQVVFIFFSLFSLYDKKHFAIH